MEDKLPFKFKKFADIGLSVQGLYIPDDGNVFNDINVYGEVEMFHCPKVIEIPSVYTYRGETLPVVAIEGQPFENCIDIETLVIPKSVRYISWNGRNRQKLRNFIVEEGNEVFQSIDGVLYTRKGYDQSGHLHGKEWMELVAYPNAHGASYNVVDGTTRLDNQCFKYTSISELSLPDTLKEIGANVFYECNSLDEVVIPASVVKNEGSTHCKANFIKQ